MHYLCNQFCILSWKLYSLPFPVPSTPLSCNSTPLYSQPSGNLLTIDTIWTAVPVSACAYIITDQLVQCHSSNNFTCTLQPPGIPGESTFPDLSIQNYTLIFLNERGGQQILQMCATQLCSHTYNERAGANSEWYSVTVSAQNRVGLGSARNCTSQPISMLYHILPWYLCKWWPIVM